MKHRHGFENIAGNKSKFIFSTSSLKISLPRRKGIFHNVIVCSWWKSALHMVAAPLSHVYLLHFGKLPAGVLIVAQVLFVSHQDNGDVGAKVFHLWGPLLRDVLWKRHNTWSSIWPCKLNLRRSHREQLTETVRTVDGEAHKNDIGVWIWERAQAVVVFLTCCVPQR